ncbi:MAG: 30S ribosomal protein S20 [Candidatus Omnitrophota bacterium]
MPIKKQAYKRVRADKKRHVRNLLITSELRTLIKNLLDLLSKKEIDKARAEAQVLIKKLSKAASKGIMHKRTASRKISRIMKRLSKTGSG